MSNEDLKKYMRASSPKKEVSMFRKFINENTELRDAVEPEQNFLDSLIEDFRYVETIEELRDNYVDLFDEFEYPFETLEQAIEDMRTTSFGTMLNRISRLNQDAQYAENEHGEEGLELWQKIGRFKTFLDKANEALEDMDRALRVIRNDFDEHKAKELPKS